MGSALSVMFSGIYIIKMESEIVIPQKFIYFIAVMLMKSTIKEKNLSMMSCFNR